MSPTTAYTKLRVGRDYARLSFVGNLFLKSRQANKDTYRGTSICHVKSNTAENGVVSN